MQTFLPYKDFEKTAKCLDIKRLGKQRVEAMQILQILSGLTKSKAWKNHPAVKMWKGYETVLSHYAYAICDQWTSHGYKDTCKEKIHKIMTKHFSTNHLTNPPWLGDRKFHKSHQSNLVRKNYEYYIRFFDCSSDLPYVWPV